MYDWDCEVDEDWDNFLKEFTRPLTQDGTTEDDPEADPEYNILEDEETEFLDKEELRADKAVKVTRKELNNLIAELFEFTDTFEKEEMEISRKKKIQENSSSSIENNYSNCTAPDALPTSSEPENPKLMNTEQWQLLGVQLRQHVQLMAQHFVMTFMHPDLHSHSKTCKQNLNSIRYLTAAPNSAFNAINLPEALKLVSSWEEKFLDNKFCEEYKKSVAAEDVIRKIYLSNRWTYIPKFPPEMKNLLAESKALMHPQLLPEGPFKSETTKYTRTPYLKSEESLVALGIEQFLPFVASRPRKFKSKKIQIMDASHLIAQYLLPCREPTGIFNHIQKRRRAKDPNPIKHYFEKGSAPRTIHYILSEYELKAPKDQPTDLLPSTWQTYLNEAKEKMDLLKRKHILDSHKHFMKNDSSAADRKKTYPTTSDAHPVAGQESSTQSVTRNSARVDEDAGNCDENVEKSHDSGHLEKASNAESNAPRSFEEFENEPVQPRTSPESKPEISGEPKRQKKTVDSEKIKEAENTPTKPTKHSKKCEMANELPQLRKTTPRLAKTRSAQNMKLMAQVLGSKGLSSCNALKSKDKHSIDKSSQKPSVLSKVDNEEEIAELMLASTTIKKDSVSRKKAKEARELENIKRLLESESPLNEEERGSKFAASYLQKLHSILESHSPETFRAVMKLYLDYNEKLDNISQTESELCYSGGGKSLASQKTVDGTLNEKDNLAIKLYGDLCKLLHQYPELCTDFLLFLKPHQAAMIDKSIEYMMLQKMNEFISVSQIYFAKQPSRIAKMMQAITQLSSDPHITLESLHTAMGPVLKGHSLVMDLFLQVIPHAKPPESLFAPHMFEHFMCPLGPHDKNKYYAQDAPELYENIELSVLSSQEDPYGGENCKCNCHSVDGNPKSISEHCVSCGTRFLNGRIYLQTSEGLRPAKIIFPGADEEKLENIARVSLTTADKFVTPTSSRQRRKSSKTDSAYDEFGQKHDASKTSPVKDNEELEKAIVKSKKAKPLAKSGEQKKALKRLGTADRPTGNTKIRVTQCKNKRERRNERQDLKSDDDELTPADSGSSSREAVKENSSNVNHETLNCGVKLTRIDASEIKSNSSPLPNAGNVTPWTRQEDMILLQNIKQEYSENSLAKVSQILGSRSIDQVKERCVTLLSLLEQMM